MVNRKTVEELIMGAIFDFAAYLTTRDETIKVGAKADASPMVELIKDWSKRYKIDKTEVNDKWTEELKELTKQEEITNKSW